MDGGGESCGSEGRWNVRKLARQGGAERRRLEHRHLSKIRCVAYHLFPSPEVNYRETEKALNRALSRGTIFQWFTSRSGQSWYFAGSPGAAMRALLDEVFALLGGEGHVREWKDLPGCKHSDCWADCREQAS